jgi:hypothetical protein
MEIKEKTFNELKSVIKPFDLICFRGSDIVSDLISEIEKYTFKNGDFTHVGMVITTDIITFNNGIPGKLYVWESTLSGPIGGEPDDIETNSWKFGVQIRDLEEVIQNYITNNITKVGWCRLMNNPIDMLSIETKDEYDKRISILKSNVQEFHTKYEHCLYDFKILTMIKTIFPSIDNNLLLRKIFTSNNLIFCSELVCALYEVINIISKTVDPSEIAPVELIQSSYRILEKIVDDPILFEIN